ncbi:EI24 domain-containing protein [Holophaga foetida]|uniref:EI24 domain-containing protein n=1 Tax=Holophaga foetida TaxID=35839 RepID=UPI0002472A74|nr:EI24 domain-containing protein [Holophaga foetida]
MHLKRLKNALWWKALREAGTCLGLGVRDALSRRLLWRSAFLVMGAFGFWTLLCQVFHRRIGEVADLLAMTSAQGVLLTVAKSLPMFRGESILDFGGGGGFPLLLQILIVLAMVVAVLVVLAFLFVVATSIYLTAPRLLLSETLLKVGRRYGGETPSTPPVEIKGRSPTLRVFLILLALSVPVIAGITLILLGCYIHPRALFAVAAKRMPSLPPWRPSLRWRWRPLLLIGVALMALLAIPVFNLAVPAIMCTSILHLLLRPNYPTAHGALAPSLERE